MKPVGILLLLETPLIDGVAKPMLEFAEEAARVRAKGTSADSSAGPSLQISFAIFLRRGADPGTNLIEAAKARGVSVYPIREERAFDLGILRQLRDAIRRSGADIVVTNGMKSHFLFRAAGLYRGVRWVGFHHGDTTTDKKVLVYNRMGRWGIRRAERVLTVCQPFARQLESVGVDPAKIRTQHLSIRPPVPVPAGVTAQLRDKLALPANPRVLLAVGRLSKEKGQADLIQALAVLAAQGKFPGLCLVIVGAGVDLEGLKQLGQELGVADRLRFEGFRTNVADYLAIADVLVLPSHSEGCPNVLLEAMAAGVPVVATSVGGIPELATSEVDALLVPRSDIPAMSAAITRILEDKALGQRLAAAGRAILQTHSPEIYFRRITANLGISPELPRS